PVAIARVRQPRKSSHGACRCKAPRAGVACCVRREPDSHRGPDRDRGIGPFVPGAVAGLVFANLAGKAVLSLLPPSPVPLVIDVAIHGHGLIAAAFLAVVAALAFSTIPAVRATNDNLVDALRDSTLGAGHGLTAARGRRRSVATQVALATVLLVTAGLFVRSLQKARSVNPGFRVGPMLLATIDAGPQFPDPARGRSFYRDL